MDTKNAIATLLHPKSPTTKSARYIRTKLSPTEQLEALNSLDTESERVHRSLTGVCIARSWNDVVRRREAHVISNPERSIGWLGAIMHRHSGVLVEHIKIKAQFERAVLTANLQAAQDSLQDHVTKCGYSLWLLRNTLLLAEEKGGGRARREILEKLRNTENTQFAAFFASKFSVKADKTVTQESFRIAIGIQTSAATGAFRHFLEFLFFDDTDETWDTSLLLSFLEMIPVVDRYEAFLRIAINALSEGHEDADRFIRLVIQLGELLPEPLLSYLAECAVVIHPTRSPNVDTPSALVLQAWDAYVTGDYIGSYRISDQLVSQHPELFLAHELRIRSALYIGIGESNTATTPVTQLGQHLRDVFSKNEETEASLNALRRFASRYSIATLSGPLRGLYAQHSSSHVDDRRLRIASHSFAVHGPRNFEYGHLAATNTMYLAQCSAAYSGSIALKFFLAISRGEEIDTRFATIPRVRKNFFGGLAEARLGNLGSAKERLTAFLSMQTAVSGNPLSPFAIEEARRTLILLYKESGDIRNLLTEIVAAYSERAQAALRIPLTAIYKYALERREEAAEQIEYPILAYLACDEPHDVSLSLKRFLKSVNADRPSSLIGRTDFNNRTMAILFLRVCSPEVLDSVRGLKTVAAVEAERLSLLVWVSEHESSLAQAARSEILKVTQRAQLREAIQKIEGARVVLNTAALREAENARFADAYFHYAAQRELATQVTQSAAKEEFELLGRPGGGFIPVQRSHADQSKELLETEASAFAAAFQTVRDAFISSPQFGIESCLSGRIRHGFVVEHLRKPLVGRKLAMRGTDLHDLDLVGYWSLRVPPHTTVQVMSVLATLTERVDKIAEEVKTVWIQSRTESKNPLGLFDFSLSLSALAELQRKVNDARTVDMFVDVIFEFLLHRTRESLRKIQARVRSELVRRLCGEVDFAMGQLSGIDDSVSFLTVRNDLVACRSELERACQEMARWFSTSDATLMGDVEFELVGRTAIGMIERLNPAFSGKHQLEVEASYRVRGRYFSSLVHVVFFLLENAIRYSGVSRNLFRSILLIRAETNRLQISVTNLARSAENAAEAAARIKKAVAELQRNLDPGKVVREGGSGLAKVIATIRYEFKQPGADVNAFSNEADLTVDVRCELAGIVV